MRASQGIPQNLVAFRGRKPDFDLWLSIPVLAFHTWFSFTKLYPTRKMLHSYKDINMVALLDFFRGLSRPANWYCLKFSQFCVIRPTLKGNKNHLNFNINLRLHSIQLHAKTIISNLCFRTTMALKVRHSLFCI